MCLKSLGNRLTDIALSAGMKPLENLVNITAGSLTSSLTAGLSGDLSSLPRLRQGRRSGFNPALRRRRRRFRADLLSDGGGLGLMGEAGSEGHLPLKRGGSDGRLGVAAGEGGGAAARRLSSTFQPRTPAASASRSEISAMLTRAAARGKRGV